MKSKPIQLLLLLIFSTLFFSCDNEETAQASEPSFFNLNVGNQWVYKKYENSYDNPTQFTFTGVVDSVKIVGTETIQGFTFAKKSSKKVNIFNGEAQPETFSYVRINNAGHLVEISIESTTPITESSGTVLHPGNDTNYTYSNNIFSSFSVSETPEVLGIITFQLYSSTNLTVEGSTYNVIPYNGVFTPSPNHPELISKTVEYHYAPSIGFVKSVCHALAGNYIWEERLVSYEVN